MSVYPESFSKYQIFSWFANQTSDLVVFIEACFIADFLLLSTAVLGFFYFFIVLQKDKFFVEKVLPFYKNLNFRQKMLFGSFTFFIAIPNKFWINNKTHFIWVFVISFIIYIMYLVLCLQSLIFAISYENSDYFKRFSNWVIFSASEEPFASEYFEWFWRPCLKKLVKKQQQRHSGTVKMPKNWTTADKQTDKADGTHKGFETPQDRANFHKDRRDEWTEENGTITWGIKRRKSI